MIYLPRGIAVRENVNPARINLPEAMEKLRAGTFTGYLRFDSNTGCGVMVFERGKLISALFVNKDETQRLIAYDAISKIFRDSIEGHTVLNIFRLSVELALQVHATLHGQYLYKGQDLKLIDVSALLDKIKKEQIDGCLRVYAGKKTTLIFYEQGIALGFFHDGSTELEFDADLSMSVARMPNARVDLLQITNSTDLSLADLMTSADLGPIWQKVRKTVLDERRKNEEATIRSQEKERESRRQRILTSCKTIAGAHVGKFGIAQVEKVFSQVGPDATPEELDLFYTELQRQAKLVAGPKKVRAMMEEMKRQHGTGS